MKKYHISFLFICLIMLGTQVRAEGGFKLYGVTMDFTIEQAIAHGLENNMSIQTTVVPDKYRNNSSISKQELYPTTFRELFYIFKDRFGIEDIPNEKDVESVETNIKPLIGRKVCEFAKVELYGDALISLNYFKGKNGEFQCYEITFSINHQAKNSASLTIDQYAKDVSAVLEERYGKPKEYLSPEAQKPQMEAVQGMFGMVEYRQAQQQSPPTPCYYWQIGQQYASAFNSDGKGSPLFVKPFAVINFFNDTLQTMNALIDEQEANQKRQQEEESKKRKSSM